MIELPEDRVAQNGNQRIFRRPDFRNVNLGVRHGEERIEKREEGGAPSDRSFSLLTSRFSLLFDQVLLKHHQVIRMSRIPPDADHVVAQADGEVDELTLVVHALAADELITMILRPRLLRFLKL